jgi:CubicO group peptidase (beta-lactamase class C family)
MKNVIVKSFQLIVLLFCILLVNCSEDSDPQINSLVLDNIFEDFSPIYNYTDESTELLAHGAKVISPKGNWSAYKGVKDSLRSEEIDANSLFRIGSATKMFTAVIILQLWEEGLINLDASFNTYLSLYEETHPNITDFNGVTIRHLLSHRSGIPRISSTTFFDYYYYTDAITQEERLKFLFTDGEPEFAPGTQYAYRNSNFNILGYVIEKITGDPYYKVLQDRIYNKIGLTNTYLLNYDLESNNSQIAHGYTGTFDGINYHGSQAWAAGGILSTVDDLSIFMKALVEGRLFLNNHTFDLMVTSAYNSHYGLGIFLTETEEGISYGHGGAIFGYNIKLEYFTSSKTIIISTLSFYGYDFFVVNWFDDFCYPILEELQ